MSILADTVGSIRNLFERARRAGQPLAPSSDNLDEYIRAFPSHQNAIDLLPGWNQAFPPGLGLNAGHVHLYHDPRILWAIEQFGSLQGRNILEIGPLEGSHTAMLDSLDPATLDSVEANNICFLRCLVTKEILRLRHARFYLGDCQLWLEQRPDRYDFIVASGVLYHMKDPLRLIDAIAHRTDTFFLWTHFADDRAMPPEDPRRGAFVGPAEIREHMGVQVRLHPRSYMGAWKDKAFCGGMNDLHSWIERDDLLKVIEKHGFDDVRIWGEEPQHAYGPAFCVFARRSAAFAGPGNAPAV
jgi:hypothetical protein